MTQTKLEPIKDYLGHIVDGSYNMNVSDIYCVTCANADTFKIDHIKRRVCAISTTCGDLVMSFTQQPLAAAPAPPALPASLPLSLEGRILITDREHPSWFYIPKGVETLYFYCGRAGQFNAIFMDAPEQMEDAPC